MKRRITSFALLAALLLAVCLFSACKTVRYDLTGETDKIARIELIVITNASDYVDEPEYSVIREIPREEWDGLLSDAAVLDYSNVIGEPLFLREGGAVKITYSEPVDGMLYFMYCKSTYCKAFSGDSGIRFNSYTPRCDAEQWDAFWNKYYNKGSN